MYRVIQLTNNNTGAVDAGALLPLGSITRRYGCKSNNCSVFEVSTTGSNTVTVFEDGYYHLTYNGSLIGSEAGEVIVTLLVNGIEIISSSQTIAAAEDVANVSMSYIIRVLPSCNACINTPVTIQLQLSNASVALTGGSGNLILEKTR